MRSHWQQGFVPRCCEPGLNSYFSNRFGSDGTNQTQALQLRSSWTSSGVPSRNCWGSLRRCLSPLPNPPILWVFVSFTRTRHNKAECWTYLAATGDRSWGSEPDQEHPLHPFLRRCCRAAVLRLEPAAAVRAVNVCTWEKKSTWAFKGDRNSEGSHCEYKRTERKGLKKLMDPLPALQRSGHFWLRNSLSSHYKACVSRAKEVDSRLERPGKYRAALPWCTLVKLVGFLSPRFHPSPIIPVC